MSDFKVLHDRVLILPLDHEDKETESGIVLAADNEQRMQRAEVISVGAGRMINGELRPLDVKPGDIILHNLANLEEVRHERVKYHIISEGQILAVEEE